MKKKALVWLRNNLRLVDNTVISEALRNSSEISFVYCFPDLEAKTSYGFAKTGKFRAAFLADSLLNLQKDLQSHGQNLTILSGEPAAILPKLISENKVQDLYFSKEEQPEEVETELSVLDKLPSTIKSHTRRVNTLLSWESLPFLPEHTPEQFTLFRKKVEEELRISDVDNTDGLWEKVNSYTLKSDAELPLEELLRIAKPDIPYQGGESAGLQRLADYTSDRLLLSSYKQTRNQLLGLDYSSKFSPWLANGCLSPRTIYWRIKDYEALYGSNDSTYWMVFELLWREYWKLLGFRYGEKLYQPSGPKGITSQGAVNWEKFKLWKEGRTGIPFVDANMLELAQTGFMSNRGRQNVASFLVKDLGVHWLLGAEYFESKLIDYDPDSNYGNWAYVAGVGNDPRKNRYFNVVKQSRDYDREGLFIKHWLPQLEGIPAKQLHDMDGFNRKLYDSVGYPYPEQLPLAFR